MGKKTTARIYSAKGSFILTGNIIKNGLDTSRLVNLVVCFDSPEEFRMDGRPVPPNIFYINEISFKEAMGILIHKFNFSEEETKIKLRRWITNYNIIELKYDSKIQPNYEKIVEQANEKVVSEKGENYRIGPSDIIILAGFLKEKITFVHARDKGIEATCGELGLNLIPTPVRDIEKEKKIKSKSK